MELDKRTGKKSKNTNPKIQHYQILLQLLRTGNNRNAYIMLVDVQTVITNNICVSKSNTYICSKIYVQEYVHIYNIVVVFNIIIGKPEITQISISKRLDN